MTVYILTHMWVIKGSGNGVGSTAYIDKDEAERNFFEAVEELKAEYQEEIQSNKYDVFEDTNEYTVFNFDKPNRFTESITLTAAIL